VIPKAGLTVHQNLTIAVQFGSTQTQKNKKYEEKNSGTVEALLKLRSTQTQKNKKYEEKNSGTVEALLKLLQNDFLFLDALWCISQSDYKCWLPLKQSLLHT
jgi:hypothetical protein